MPRRFKVWFDSLKPIDQNLFISVAIFMVVVALLAVLGVFL